MPPAMAAHTPTEAFLLMALRSDNWPPSNIQPAFEQSGLKTQIEAQFARQFSNFSGTEHLIFTAGHNECYLMRQKSEVEGIPTYHFRAPRGSMQSGESIVFRPLEADKTELRYTNFERKVNEPFQPDLGSVMRPLRLLGEALGKSPIRVYSDPKYW